MDHDFKPVEYLVLDPHAQDGDGSDSIPIDEIATRVYGKAFASLRAAQADEENARNDSVIEYCLADEDTYSGYLEQFDSTTIRLGWNEATRRHVVKTGMTQLDYWLSITWVEDKAEHIDPETAALWDMLWAQGERAYFEDNPWVAGQWAKYKAGELPILMVNPPDGTDLENAVFSEEFFANRAFSPSLGAVLADLIRRDELPRANYLFKHWW